MMIVGNHPDTQFAVSGVGSTVTTTFGMGKVYYSPCSSCPRDDANPWGFACRGHEYRPDVGGFVPLPLPPAHLPACPTCGRCPTCGEK